MLLTCRRAGRLSFLCSLTLCCLAVLLSVLFALCAVSFRLFDLGVRPPARPPVFLPPGVQGRRSTVHGPLHKAKVGPAVLAGSVALPPVLAVHVDLVVETVVDLEGRHSGDEKGWFDDAGIWADLFQYADDSVTEIAEGPGSKCGNQKILSMRRRSSAYSNLRPSGFVDPVHMFTELWTVAISVSVVRGHKQQRMDHFMKESLREQNNKTIYLENVSIVCFFFPSYESWMTKIPKNKEKKLIL